MKASPRDDTDKQGQTDERRRDTQRETEKRPIRDRERQRNSETDRQTGTMRETEKRHGETETVRHKQTEKRL